MKGTNEEWTVTKINFPEKVAQNVDLVHFSIGHFIYSGAIKRGLSPHFYWCLHMTSYRFFKMASVCLSHPYILLKRIKISLKLFCYWVPIPF